MYKNRHIHAKVLSLAKISKVLLITGARQVGKSTLLENLFPGVELITFDPATDVKGARKDPDFFLQDHPAPIILDEIQYTPQLLPIIKRIVDKSPVCPQYFMTGSQNLSMLSSVAESMAGRVTIVHLSPMTIYEIQGLAGEPTWIERYLQDPLNLKSYATGKNIPISPLSAIWRGGMPGLLDAPPEEVHDRLSSYVTTYLEKDIRLSNEVASLDEFRDFIGIMAALTAQEINYDQLGREIDVEGSIAKKWVSLMKQHYQWKDIPSYHANTIKKIAKKRKGYFLDTGLACYLQYIGSPEALRSHPLRGALFETYVANTIDTVLSCVARAAKLYHWRTPEGNEVDLVITLDNKLFPVEIKMKARLSSDDARGIQAFRKAYENSGYEIMPGVIVYVGDECYRVNEHTYAVPWNMLVK